MVSHRSTLISVALGLAFGLMLGACGDDGSATTGSDTGSTSGASADTGLVCQPGGIEPCVCTDGTDGVQSCLPDGSGLGACECGAESASASGDSTSAASTTSGGSGDGTSTGPGASTGDVETGDGSSTGIVGTAPTAQINHPGDGEERQVDVPIPFVGVGSDAEDGALSGMSLQWSSDVEGMIGTGEMFDASLSTLGMHVITLTVTDSDGNTAQDTVNLMIVM